jgi:hypothetical protein
MEETLTVMNMPVTVQSPPRWWTVRDVAEYRGLSESAIYTYVCRARKLRKQGKEGGIPFTQPRGTGALRFRPEAVKRFFEGEQESGK